MGELVLFLILLLLFCIAFTTQLKENSFDYVSIEGEEEKP